MTFAILQAESKGFGSTLASLPWIDQVGLALVVVFTLLGVWRGLWWQVIRLLGVCLAVAVARTVTPNLQPAVMRHTELSESVSHGLVWFVIFLLGLVVASLLGLMGKKALEAMQLGPMDRAGGAVAGAMTGLILHAAFLVLISALGTNGFATRTFEGSRSRLVLNQIGRRWHVMMDAQAATKILDYWPERWDEPEAE